MVVLPDVRVSRNGEVTFSLLRKINKRPKVMESREIQKTR